MLGAAKNDVQCILRTRVPPIIQHLAISHLTHLSRITLHSALPLSTFYKQERQTSSMSAAASGAKNMRSAAKWLCRVGEEALKPQKVNEVWKKPKISKRIAGVLRKQAIQEGTFGSFDPETGKGWDPKWDSLRQTGTMQLRPPKLNTRQRTREQRATKIEKLMEDMDEKIDAHYDKLKEGRTKERTFENWYKDLSRLVK